MGPFLKHLTYQLVSVTSKDWVKFILGMVKSEALQFVFLWGMIIPNYCKII